MAYSIFSVFYALGVFVPYTILKDSYTAMMAAMGYAAEMIDSMVAVYTSPVIILSAMANTILWACVGVLVGTKIFKKHFKAAGVA